MKKYSEKWQYSHIEFAISTANWCKHMVRAVEGRHVWSEDPLEGF